MIASRHVIAAMLTCRAIYRPEDQAHHDQHQPSERRRAEDRLGVILQQIARNPAGYRRDDDEHHAALALGLHAPRLQNGEERLGERHPFLPEEPHERDQRAEVQRDVEGEPGRGPSQDPRGEGEVRGAADRKKLGETLDDAEHDRLEDCHGCRVLGIGSYDTAVA
jgi:hypothetical protein